MPLDPIRTRSACLALALLAAVAATAARAQSQAGPDGEAFERDVRPVLVERCQKCHGPDKQKGGLRVDSRRSLLEGGDSGPALVAGRPGESPLVAAVRRAGDLKMPPDRPLAPAQVAALERWVAAGAPWPADAGPAAMSRQDAWAAHWAFRPVADPRPPEVRDPAWCRTPVDRFIAAKRDAKGLPASPPIDRRGLIRRVAEDLTGLPPTPEQVRAFLADDDPRAYESLVERLLASPQYGEHWARHWLDVARYADTKGYVYAREERALVQAPAYRDWVVAAFNADLPYDRFLVDQVAADQAEPGDPKALAALGFLTVGRRFLGVTHDIIDDRIDVLTRGTMGLTVACARCHDHKFDPIPTADYYSLYGVFQNCTERLVPIAEPAARDDAYLAFEKELSLRQENLRNGMEASRAEAAARVRARVADYLLAQRDLSKIPVEGFDVVLEKGDLNPASVRRWQAYLAAAAKRDDPIFRPWQRYAAIPDDGFADRARAAAIGPTPNRRVAEAFAEPPATVAEVAARYARLFADADRPGPDGRKPADDDARALREVLESDRGPCVVPDEPIVSTEWFFDSATVVAMWELQGEVDRWLIQSPQAPPHAVALVDRAELREPQIFKRGSSANRGDEVPRRFLRLVAGPDRRPFQHGSGRLELARAIADPANPLTARVWVNRIWMHHFGAGLVRTPSDFGIRAEPPSHPELLDWLARRLVEGGWSTKAIHRLIVLSSTYQQQSAPPADDALRVRADRDDPENRLLSRMNPRRLGFEELRDALLATTGELDPRAGGRPADLFPAGGTNRRRSLYGTVDRQFLPGVLRSFDFANPDLHIPARSETTVPQQALFALNHPFVADRARALAARLPADDPAGAVRQLFQAAYRRDPADAEARAALDFIHQPPDESEPAVRPESLAWRYGYVAVDPMKGPAGPMQPLPHFDGAAWGGGPQWPDPKLGWVRITAEGGHPGNDLAHASVRRWTAPRAGTVEVRSTLVHAEAVGDGVRGWVVSSRHGVLKSATVHDGRAELSADAVAVEPGDTIDFVVDIRDGLNSDQHLWSATIREAGGAAAWDSRADFAGPAEPRLTPWEQLAQVLLMSNEFLFVD